MGSWIPKLTKGHLATVSAQLRELPPEELRSLLARAGRVANRDWRVYPPMALAVTLSAAALLLTPELTGRASPLRSLLQIALLVAGFASMIWSDVLRRRVIRRHLAARFPTLCPACGYDRRATPARCPECGTESPAAP